MGEADDLSGGGKPRGGGEPPEAGATPANAGGAPPARGAPRLSYEAVVRLRCDGRLGIHTGFVRDISRGGMFLRLVDPEPAGKRLGFELFLPGWRVPARGIGEVAWQRPRYEGPGRPPGMAIRFVALEPVGIEMLARVLPDGEAPAVEVLRPRPLPPPPAIGAAAIDEKAVEAPAIEPAASGAAMSMEELEELIAEAGIAPPPAASLPAVAAAEDELGAPMIFVPPPPLPVPLLPEWAAAAVPAPAGGERVAAGPLQRLRWGSAAAGIAAFAGLATLVVVGAARREVTITPSPGRAASAAIAGAPAAPASHGDGEPDAPAIDVVAPGARAKPTVNPPAAAAAAASSPAAATSATGAAAAPASNPTSAPARRLVSLRWEPLAAGGTRLVATFDGDLGPGRVRASRIGGEAPRLVVRLLGVGDGAPVGPWEPATAEVRRVRAGRHDGAGGGELHLVLDLAAPDLRLAATEVAGSELRLELRRNLAPAP